MTIPFIGFDEMNSTLTWQGVMDAMIAGHKLPPASIADGFAYRDDDTLLSRAAWINGLGAAVKSATIVPGNVAKGLPTIHGGVMVFSDETAELEAVIDFHLVTKWKTAGDSLLGAKLLARADLKNVLIIGAGQVSRSLVAAYSSAFGALRFSVWNRSIDNAKRMVNDLSASFDIGVAADLPQAVEQADVICCATMTTEPVLRGEWLREGQHVDLIGAYRPDMREADDVAVARSRIFVDSRETTVKHIGELMSPIQRGVISELDVVGDFYQMVDGSRGRKTDAEITLFKNGGGAHLDLMTAKYILKSWREIQP
ncbi:MAG: ornithine cyclodeaminase [Rhodobacteraceae bacterium]|nr:ornithine cyclodeaminase [Paracoccaceae bacterium]